MKTVRSVLYLYSLMFVLAVSSAPALAHPVAQNATNLVQHGDFENGTLGSWDMCGGVHLADTQAGATPLEVHGGRYALRLGYPTDDSCPGGVLALQQQAYYPNIVVPNDASGLSLRFWYSRIGDFGGDSNFWTLTAMLNSTDDNLALRVPVYVYASSTAGWNQAHLEFSADELAQARGHTFELGFSFQFSLSADKHLAYYIDDIQIQAVTMRTPVETAAPNALVSDTDRSFIGYTVLEGKGRTVRANLNGSNLTPLYAGSADNGGQQPLWSKDGAQIAVRDDTLQQEPGEAISLNSAQITAVTVMNPDGSNQHEVYRTSGKKLVPGSPPGCRPPRTDCARYDDPALDVLIIDYDWSPNGRAMALNICSSSRYADGYTSDSICSIQFLDLMTGQLQADTIEHATDVSWSSANRVVYRVNIEGPLLYNTPKGIYETDLNTSPPTTRLLFAHESTIDTYEDISPTWAPDGRFFVTQRTPAGNHYDANGARRLNHALALFDRENPDNPRQLVLVDFGRAIDSAHWSPDGRYLSYSVDIGENMWQTWWLEVATGTTGVLADNMIFADWRPTANSAALPFTTFLPAVIR